MVLISLVCSNMATKISKIFETCKSFLPASEDFVNSATVFVNSATPRGRGIKALAWLVLMGPCPIKNPSAFALRRDYLMGYKVRQCESEQVRVRACSQEQECKFGVVLIPCHQPVGLDVTLPLSFMVARQLVWTIFGGQCTSSSEQGDRIKNQL